MIRDMSLNGRIEKALPLTDWGKIIRYARRPDVKPPTDRADPNDSASDRQSDQKGSSELLVFEFCTYCTNMPAQEHHRYTSSPSQTDSPRSLIVVQTAPRAIVAPFLLSTQRWERSASLTGNPS
jgi:hypothetical protein